MKREKEKEKGSVLVLLSFFHLFECLPPRRSLRAVRLLRLRDLLLPPLGPLLPRLVVVVVVVAMLHLLASLSVPLTAVRLSSRFTHVASFLFFLPLFFFFFHLILMYLCLHVCV